MSLLALLAGRATPPPPNGGTLSISNVTKTSFRLTVTGASDPVSGLHEDPYRFSINGGSTWSAWQSSNVYDATGLTPDTTYQPRAQVRNNADPPSSVTVTAADVTTEAGPLIHSIKPGVLDWDSAVTLVTAGDISKTELREQDSILFDPDADPSRRWCFYFSSGLRIYVMHSADGDTWGTPTLCELVGGGALVGEDPSITRWWGDAEAVVYRDGDGLLHMFTEGGDNVINAYSSTDGITWTLTKAGAIDRTGSVYDVDLVGSPSARWDGEQFIVGYEGIRLDPRVETFSIAWGPSPSALSKGPNNPLILPSAIGLDKSCVVDDMWVTPDGNRVILVGHDGLGAPVTMFRIYTDNVDPTTWDSDDFVLIGMVDPTVRNDLTTDLRRERFITAPVDDSELVVIPLVAPGG